MVVGAGGVGSSIASIAAGREFFEGMVLADIDIDRAQRVVDKIGDPRFSAISVDASRPANIAQALKSMGCDAIINAADPRYVVPIFDGAFDAGAIYVDMAMSTSTVHPGRPHEACGLKLGDLQFNESHAWEQGGRLAIVGMGVEPGFSDVAARYAADELFSEIHEIGVRDGANLVVRNYAFAPTFSVWTVIEECLNPPVIWERGREWFTTEPFSEPEVFWFPEGIGPIECVNVEHEEVLLIPRWIDCDRVTFKYGLGDEFIEVLKVIRKLGLDSTQSMAIGGGNVSPRDFIASHLPDPASLGDQIDGKTCAGTWVKGLDKEGQPAEKYVYHVVDNADTMGRHGSQAVLWQTAINPVIALELVAQGIWSGAGVLGPEAFPPIPFLDLLAGEYKSPWGIDHSPRRELVTP